MKLPAVIAAAHACAALAIPNGSCYRLPGDAGWPSASAWAALNATTGGRLIATVPIGTPCHDPNYNAAECLSLQTKWTEPQLHEASSSSVMQPFFANQSCDPFTPQSRPCLLGNYVSYAVNVSSSADVVAAIQFARNNSIRFVIRNTGHDYFGRSTGAGALAVWTQHLKNIQVLNWQDSSYTGPAIKMGAGVLGYELLDAAASNKLVALTGTCPTVGVAGGYTQGGGHSLLSTNFGLGADQTLEFEVVTAAGQVVTASRTQNKDLYWALSGGGGGNYAVVLSTTVRAYPDAKVGGAFLALSANFTTTDNFYKAISRFHEVLPNITDSGASAAFAFNSSLFYVNPITAYNQTSVEVKAMLAPFIATLTELAIPFSVSYSDYASYRDHYNEYLGPLPYGRFGVESYQYGSRLIPRSVIKTSNDALQAALRNVTSNGVLMASVAVNTSRSAYPPNSVSSAWRDATVHMQMLTPWSETAPWSDMIASQYRMTNEYVPQIEAVTPNSGAYLNEADFRQPNFQQTFFGANYNRLLALKRRWDPESIFFALKGVGSEFWSLNNNGRLCRI